ncbi:helix-turn-helix domain-containing protein [Brevibacillus halotolerans]|uniref:helix-turn-helix domain-containing protein n=1 Tax=Brevibacillus TaxID=55080 RepID=UPI00215B8CC9|nr:MULTISPECIES: helix-turn-helix domain-containing protein [Brevibacillus]MCR8964213.1 helix-turn-helix domain-containing protein [Brevibacillus laterosporus]MCZ0836368.1 helix-turn-helix domain-containing protein [Brevibacillus halotolerans]
MEGSLNFTAVGDLIRIKREQMGMSISELGRVSGVSKSILARLESGETKRPELKTIKAISDVMDLPYKDIFEYYAETEIRIDALEKLILEAIEIKEFEVIPSLAQKLLISSNEDTYTAIERLHNFTETISNEDVRLILYNFIIKYARQHGIPKYVAKGLLSKYLIDIQDLNRVEETFKEGEEILHYTDFLSQKERINFYYEMAFLAHGIKKYEKCIELGKVGHSEDKTNNERKERVALAICNSYFRINDFSNLEEHLEMYEKLGYSFIVERTKTFRSVILSKKGEYDEAIPLLKECVEEATDNNRIHRVNELIEALFTINDTDSLQQIFEQEEKNTLVKIITTYKFSELGKYFKYKGMYFVNRGLFEKGMESYLQSMNYYCKISDREGIMDCSEKIYGHHCEQGKVINLGLLNKMKEVYNIVKNGDGKGSKDEKILSHSHDYFAGIM